MNIIDLICELHKIVDENIDNGYLDVHFVNGETGDAFRLGKPTIGYIGDGDDRWGRESSCDIDDLNVLDSTIVERVVLV